MENEIQNLIDEAINEDFQNTLFDIYEQETGLEPVPEDGGHTDKFEDWFVYAVHTAYLTHGIRDLESLKHYFEMRHLMRPDRSRDRTNYLARMLAEYGINGAGADETPEQKRLAGICVEAAIRLMQSDLMDEITTDEGEAVYTESQLIDEWKRLSREAKRLSE